MRFVLFAVAAVFIFLGAASLLSVFMMPWLLAYGFSAPAALLLMLGGVLLLALAMLLDGLRRVESAIYGVQQSLRSASTQAPAVAGPQMADLLQAVPPSPQMAETRNSVTMPAMAPSREHSGPRKSVMHPGGAQSGMTQAGMVQTGMAQQAAPPEMAPPAPTASKQGMMEHLAGAPPRAKTTQERKDKPTRAEVPGVVSATAESMPKASPEEKGAVVSAEKGKEMPQPVPAPEAETTPQPEGQLEPGPKPEAVVHGMAENGEMAAEKNRAAAAEEVAAALPETSSTEKEVTLAEEALLPKQEKSTGGEEKTGEGSFLYIVREEMVRGRRARVLSDGTIEAELDEGWLRFENMDHLNEYLDALEELHKKGMI